MTEGITKAELQAMIEVQTKSAEHLALIAKNLSDIANKEEKIQQRLYNGLSKEITNELVKELKECNTAVVKVVALNKETLAVILTNTVFLKWIYGGLFALVALAWLILQVLEHLAKGH